MKVVRERLYIVREYKTYMRCVVFTLRHTQTIVVFFNVYENMTKCHQRLIELYCSNKILMLLIWVILLNNKLFPVSLYNGIVFKQEIVKLPI